MVVMGVSNISFSLNKLQAIIVAKCKPIANHNNNHIEIEEDLAVEVV